MNPPQVYPCSPSRTLLPSPSPYPPSGSSQCTSPKHPVSCIEPGLAMFYKYINLGNPVTLAVKSESEVAQSCPTLSDPVDCSLPGSSVHGIFQARVLEWGAIAFTFTLHLHALEKKMATHSSVLAWRIPRTGKPGGLLSMGSHRVGHD